MFAYRFKIFRLVGFCESNVVALIKDDIIL